jgi:hypothetical protein
MSASTTCATERSLLPANRDAARQSLAQLCHRLGVHVPQVKPPAGSHELNLDSLRLELEAQHSVNPATEAMFTILPRLERPEEVDLHHVAEVRAREVLEVPLADDPGGVDEHVDAPGVFGEGRDPDVVRQPCRRAVTLSGEVDWHYQRSEAERLARHIKGVSGAVKPKASASYVERCVGEALKRSADLDARSVWVTTDDGTVHLHGHVHTFHEKQDAADAAYTAPGVSTVDNEITIQP